MKQQSVYDLWTIKQKVKDCPYMKKGERYLQCGVAIIERINKVLLEENGAGAVLYPHGNKDELRKRKRTLEAKEQEPYKRLNGEIQLREV